MLKRCEERRNQLLSSLVDTVSETRISTKAKVYTTENVYFLENKSIKYNIAYKEKQNVHPNENEIKETLLGSLNLT